MTTNGTTIRLATLDDLEHVVTFNAAIASETENKSLNLDILRPGVRAALSDPVRSLYFVAERDGAVVGQTMITVEWSDWRNRFFWWIQSVYVVPAHRRAGVFTALHEYIRNEAKSRNDVCGLRLYAYRENHRAIKTYEKLGMPVCDYVMCEEDWS